MTNLDTINLDEIQDLSLDEENILSGLGAKPVYAKQSSRLPPIVIAAIITFLAFIFNTEWLQSKLEDVPYSRFALLGLLFSAILIFMLFFS
jgi:hypothetical protein